MAKGIKGFSALRFWPVTSNTTSAYSVGEKTEIPTVVSATCERQMEDFSLNADDGIYDSGADYTGENWEIVVQELSLELMADLDGADFDAESGTYSWGPDKVAPEIAFGFRALKRDGTYRMVKYYSARVTNIQTEYRTKGENHEGSPYTISLSTATRIADNKVFTQQDSESSTDLTWLDTVDAIPVAGG